MQRVLHKLVHSNECPTLLVAPPQHYQRFLPILGKFSREVSPFFSIAETAPVVSFSQPSKTASSVHAEFRVAYESNVFLMQLPSISANKLEHYRRTRVGVVHDKVVLSAGKIDIYK